MHGTTRLTVRAQPISTGPCVRIITMIALQTHVSMEEFAMLEITLKNAIVWQTLMARHVRIITLVVLSSLVITEAHVKLETIQLNVYVSMEQMELTAKMTSLGVFLARVLMEDYVLW